MKKIHVLIIVFLLFAAIAVYFSCSGVTGDTVGDTIVVHEASSLPTIDISGIDIVSPPSGSISKVTAPGIGDPSSTGCLAMKFFRPALTDTLKQIELSKCFVKKTQEQASKGTHELVIPALPIDDMELYGYYEFAAGEHASSVTGIKSFRAKIANVSDGSSNALKMDICQSSDGTTFTHANQIEITGNLANHTWTGTEIAHNVPNPDRYFNGASFDIVMNSADDLREAFSWSNAKSANMTAYRGLNPNTEDVTDATTFDDVIDNIFTHNSLDETLGVAKQSIAGAYNDAADLIKDALFTEYTANNGASKISHEGDQGIYNDMQAFNPKQDKPTIIDSTTVAYYNDVTDVALPGTDIAAAVRQAVTYVSTWDCEVPAGQIFTQIDSAAFDYSECEQLVSTLTKPGFDTINQCFGGVSLAGNYGRISSSPVCPTIAPPITLSGTGPAYNTTSGANTIRFIFQNGFCSEAFIDDKACLYCDIDAATGSIILVNNDDCEYKFQ